MQGTDKCNAAHNSASKEPIRVGNETDTDVRSNTQTYQGQTERSEVGSRLDSLEFVILFVQDYNGMQSVTWAKCRSFGSYVFGGFTLWEAQQTDNKCYGVATIEEAFRDMRYSSVV